MGKGTDLWDDSALINAFDNAMVTYKAMHSGTFPVDSTKEEKHTSDCNQDVQVPTEITRNCESVYDDNPGSKRTTESCLPCDHIGAAADALPTQQYHLDADVYTSESNQYPTGYPSMHGQNNSYSDQQNEEYNQLLKQYYELEDQKQKVLQQLHQASYGNHQTPGQASMGEMSQASTHNISQNSLYPQCSLCLSQCPASSMVVPISCATNKQSCGSPYCCSLSTLCCSPSLPHQFPVYPVTHSSCGDDSVVKTGMMAAERAISSAVMNTSTTSNVCDDKEKGKTDKEISGAFEDKESKNASPETELTVVLNAWYAAGFHTGRYLMEQSKRTTS